LSLQTKQFWSSFEAVLKQFWSSSGAVFSSEKSSLSLNKSSFLFKKAVLEQFSLQKKAICLLNKTVFSSNKAVLEQFWISILGNSRKF